MSNEYRPTNPSSLPRPFLVLLLVVLALSFLDAMNKSWAAEEAANAQQGEPDVELDFERQKPKNLAEVMWQRRQELWRQFLRHIELVFTAMLLATTVGVTSGILLTRFPRFATAGLGSASVIQTVPSLALLALMVPYLGVGFRPAVTALTLYALLPIMRNTYTAIDEVDPSVIEVGRGMGMTQWQILFQVEIPLCVPVVMAGIRTSTVICVGIATLCTLIGAGGLGTMIINGLQQRGSDLIYAGVIPAIGLALALDGLCALAQKSLTPTGLKLSESH